ncbi:MAG: polysaccharide biosynthesis/export family protein [Phyllobacterium sp.]
MPSQSTSAENGSGGARFRKLLLSAAIVLASLTGPVSAAPEEYVLGPQDKIRLKIYEWRASRDVIFEWTALNDEFTVGAGGALSLPFVGSLNASGLTPDELAKQIGDHLMRQMGLGRQPDTSVEIVQFRPFYIVGDVTQPGEFPYRPGMTVLQAVSIAGGMRTRDESLSRIEREVIAGRGDVDLFRLSNVSMLARKARLEAELADLEEIKFPDTLTARKGDSSVALLMEQERAIFKARRDGMTTQVRALEGLRDFLEKELSSLEAQLVFHDKQADLVKKELEGVSSLVTKGLAVAPREMSLQRDLAQIQSGRLQAETSLLRARQEISRTDISIIELRNRHINEVSVSLRETQGLLDELARKADTAVQLLYESEITAPRLLAQRARTTRLQPIYTIVRPTADGMKELKVDETTPVEPGDTVKVEYPLPPGLDDPASMLPSVPLTTGMSTFPAAPVAANESALR